MTPERIAELIPQALTGYYGHKRKDFNIRMEPENASS